MFFDGNIFWFLMGVTFILIAAGFKAFADDRGWVLNWWKALLGVLWYGIFALNFYALGTLIGENETGAGIKIFLAGLIVLLVLGVGLWRVMPLKSKTA